MQPAAQSGIVWKISIFLFVLLAFVLYKMNDYFKQEKWQLAQNQLRTQIVSIKTSVSSQLSTLKNVLSSYEYELSENKINWVQLDPFFGIARAERVGGQNSTQYRVTQFVGRSGSIAANWNAGYLQRSLSRQVINSDEPITIQLFQEAGGAKFMALRFSNPIGRALIVVGSAEYFQKYFDLSRGAKMTSLLETTDHILAAHSEADYLGTPMDENAISEKKFIVEKEDISGTNLVAMNFMSRKNLTKGFAVPWSVVGLILGFGLLIVGALIYMLEPIERRIEKYRMQEREQIFKNTLSENLSEQSIVTSTAAVAAQEQVATPQTATDIVQAKIQEEQPLPEPAPVVESSPLVIPTERPSPRMTFPPPPVSANDEKTVVHIPKKETVAEPTVVRTPLPSAPSPSRFDETFIPAKAGPNVSVASVVLDDVEEYRPLEGFAGANDNLDLDKALSLDDLDVDEAAKSSADFVKESLTSKKINTSNQMVDTLKPQFSVKRKDFKVDVVNVLVRRPERS